VPILDVVRDNVSSTTFFALKFFPFPFLTVAAVIAAAFLFIVTTAACSNPSATFHPPKQRRTTMCRSMSPLWWRDSNQTASGKPGSVQQ